MKTILNPRLITQQNLTPEEVSNIEELHQVKWDLLQRMKRSKKPETLRKLAEEITEVEYSLQRAWGFPTDSKWHKFWELPGCKCAKIDNYDAWPTGNYSMSQGCPIHGWEE